MTILYIQSPSIKHEKEDSNESEESELDNKDTSIVLPEYKKKRKIKNPVVVHQVHQARFKQTDTTESKSDLL
jgi:hypothetical protein